MSIVARGLGTPGAPIVTGGIGLIPLGGGGVTVRVYPAVVTASGSAYSPTLHCDATAAPSPVEATLSLSAGVSTQAYVAPGTLVATGAPETPTPWSSGASAFATPDVVVGTVTLYVPTIRAAIPFDDTEVVAYTQVGGRVRVTTQSRSRERVTYTRTGSGADTLS